MRLINGLILSVLMAMVLSACSGQSTREPVRSTSATNSAYNSSQYGRISHIDRIESAAPAGGGAIVGAVVGGVLGNQVGKGHGRAVATGAGAVGGAVVGNSLEKNRSGGEARYRVTVDFEDGRQGEYDYNSGEDLRVGDKVRVEGGQVSRY